MFDGANHVPERPSHYKKRHGTSIAYFLFDESAFKRDGAMPIRGVEHGPT